MYGVGPLNPHNVIPPVWYYVVLTLHRVMLCSGVHDHSSWTSREYIITTWSSWLSSTMSTSGDECVCTTTHMWCIVCKVLWDYPPIEGYSTYMFTRDHSNVCYVSVVTQTWSDHVRSWSWLISWSRDGHITKIMSLCVTSHETPQRVSPCPDHKWSHSTHYTGIHCIPRVCGCNWGTCVTLCVVLHNLSGSEILYSEHEIPWSWFHDITEIVWFSDFRVDPLIVCITV